MVILIIEVSLICRFAGSAFKIPNLINKVPAGLTTPYDFKEVSIICNLLMSCHSNYPFLQFKISCNLSIK